jgi:hypothetical protein
MKDYGLTSASRTQARRKMPYSTPEYTVPCSNNSSIYTGDLENGRAFSDEYLERSYQKFVSFKKKLRKIGFLSDDMETMDDFVFKSKNKSKPSRSMNYEITSFKRYSISNFEKVYGSMSAVSYPYDILQAKTTLTLFTAQVQVGFITSLSFSDSDLFVQAAKESNLFEKESKTAEKLAPISSVFSYNNTIDFLSSLRGIVANTLSSYGYQVTPEKINKVLALERFIAKGNSVGRLTSYAENSKVITDYLYALAESDANLYPCFFALSPELNTDFNKTKKFALPVDAVVELNGIPEFMLSDVMG